MSLEIAKYSDLDKSSFLETSPCGWLSEFASKSTFIQFCREHSINESGKFIEEIDYENLSGIPNLNLTDANEALSLINRLVELYKSDKFDYYKTYIKQTDEPLTDPRVFVNGKSVNFLQEFHRGFTIEQFCAMKGIEYNPEKIVVNMAIDDYTNGKHELIPGKEVELILMKQNTYLSQKKAIDTTLKFLKEAVKDNSYVQLITV